jgi:hypothetical protein
MNDGHFYECKDLSCRVPSPKQSASIDWESDGFLVELKNLRLGSGAIV